MSSAAHREVFRKGSKTYFNSSLFFPSEVRENVFILYGFVRTADDFVDAQPQRPVDFGGFVERYHQAMRGVDVGDPIVDSFVALARRYEFDPAWTDAFLRSMEMDLTKHRYETLEEMLEYIYGSAEVIGLYMARLMGLDHAADHAAAMLGRSMQLINFIRDIAEDLTLGRHYLPMAETSLADLSEKSARENRDEFERFLRLQLDRYNDWQRQAEAGYRYIPKRSLVPIKTASEMYNWTGRVIASDPMVVYRRKVKPSRGRIMARIVANALTATGGTGDS